MRVIPTLKAQRGSPFLLVPVILVLVLAFNGVTHAQEEPSLPTGLGDQEQAEEIQPKESPSSRLPTGLHGFVDARLGPRLKDDAAQEKDFTLAEIRVEGGYEKSWERVAFDFKADLVLDAVTESIDWDQRHLWLNVRAGSSADLRFGRQILSWGTGDLLFINDLFPKDWQSFFIGRETDYLKAPSDAFRLGWFNRHVNLDLVYTPQFDSDRYLTGERLSFWNPFAGEFAGQNMRLAADRPDEWFKDDEIGGRLYRNIGSVELAFYGYTGFWKSPAGLDPETERVIFPPLNVYGASVRGPLARGIGNVEIGYYDSRDDPEGGDPYVDNSEFRLLLGYEQELAPELTGSLQYYLERLLDYDAYLQTLPIERPRDENRHLVTARLTKLLMNQNLIVSFFIYLSPSDSDAYLRPKATYRMTDHWTLQLGGNWFLGSSDSTFFGQLESNSNIFSAVRFSF